MLYPADLHDYQQRAVNWQCSMPQSMLWLDMGLGKTAITLTSIAHLLNAGFLRGALIVAPIRVVRLVWKQESKKWHHLQHLTFSSITGSPDQRVRALLRPANIYLTNYENLKWIAETLQTYFVKKDRPLPFNGIVWDEVSKMKNSSTKRVSAITKIDDQFDWTTGLTGTPVSNGYKDLHGQYLVVDGGKRLGTSKTAFRTRYYKKAGPHKEVPYDDTEQAIKELIGDITLEMSAAEYNPLPDLIVNDVDIDLPARLRTMYEQLEKELFITLDSGTDIELFNKSALMNKCLQFSNGAVYPVAGMPMWEAVHDLKLEALSEVLDEANGSPVLCSYAYRSDAERIMERFKDLNPINLTECKSEGALNNAMLRWATNDCPLMIGHPLCLGGDTQVLTEQRGWVRITNVSVTDRVFDGVEFVEHKGCSYSGYKDVIDVLGITMTPGHKLLINNKWTEGKSVRDCEETRNEAVRLWKKTTHYRNGEVFGVRGGVGDSFTKRSAKQQTEPKMLRCLRGDELSQDDRIKNLADMAGDAAQGKEHHGQKLRGPWNNCVQGVALIQAVLQRHVTGLLRRFDNRADRRERSVLKGELPVGEQHGAASEQTKQQIAAVHGHTSSFGRGVPKERCQQDDADNETESRNDRRSSGDGCENVALREEPETVECSTQRKAHVYDLVDCGPRHRFVIRNASDEAFISHNSMGHGIDGLQKAGHIVVWFGLNWSLDLYDQFNARLRRQGQGAPVICHRIMIRDTIDKVQADVLSSKTTTQDGLRSAIRQYRKDKGDVSYV